ncbi:alpha/beta hydrolase [Rhizobium redzepovicii]|uniref:alpha/beta hydrolase n=1 Tax=Rhizobium redzepovicii TaxID=2867518 RepID=UPI0035C6724A
MAADIAGECGMLVAAVDFPNAVDDDLDRTLQECIATTAWVIDNLETFGIDCIFLSGESSGAHLALESLLSLRSTGRHSIVRGFYAVCGAFDLEGTASLRDSPGSALLIDGPSALENLHRLSPSLPVHRRRGPLHAVLQGLPPAVHRRGTRPHRRRQHRDAFELVQRRRPRLARRRAGWPSRVQPHADTTGFHDKCLWEAVAERAAEREFGRLE